MGVMVCDSAEESVHLNLKAAVESSSAAKV